MVICIIGTHWKTTAAHWKRTDYQELFRCILGSKSQAHWTATGLPLNYQRLRVGEPNNVTHALIHFLKIHALFSLVLVMVASLILSCDWTHPPVNWVLNGSGNGLSPVRRQTITWTSAGLFSMGLGIIWFSFMKMHLRMSSANMAVILSRWRWVNTVKEMSVG